MCIRDRAHGPSRRFFDVLVVVFVHHLLPALGTVIGLALVQTVTADALHRLVSRHFIAADAALDVRNVRVLFQPGREQLQMCIRDRHQSADYDVSISAVRQQISNEKGEAATAVSPFLCWSECKVIKLQHQKVTTSRSAHPPDTV